MSDLRERLEAESERVTLAPGAADRMFERGRRRERSRRVGALAIGAVLFVVVLAIVRASLPGGDREPQPATPTPTAPGDVAGAYSVLLPAGDPDVAALGMNGTYTMRLDADGAMELSGPRRFDLPGSPITFDVERGRLTTDAFVGRDATRRACTGSPSMRGALTFAPDRRPVRDALDLARHRWVEDDRCRLHDRSTRGRLDLVLLLCADGASGRAGAGAARLRGVLGAGCGP